MSEAEILIEAWECERDTILGTAEYLGECGFLSKSATTAHVQLIDRTIAALKNPTKANLRKW